MNRGKWIILGGAAVLLAWTLFRPKIVTQYEEADGPGWVTERVDPMLYAELGVFAAVTTALYFVFRERRGAAWRDLDRGKRGGTLWSGG